MNYYYPQQYNQFQNQQQMQPQTQQSMQGSSLVSVHDENEARMYPVGPGYSITFKDENRPYIYTKTMGFNPLDRPVFEKYKLVKEETESTSVPVSDKYALKNDLADLVNKVMDLQEELALLRGDNRKRTEGTGDVER